MIILKLDTTRAWKEKRTDEEKEHTDENEDDITQLAQGQKRKVVLVTKKMKPEEDYVT